MAKKKMSKPNLAKLIVEQRIEDLSQIIPVLEENYESLRLNGDKRTTRQVELKLHRYRQEYKEITGKEFESKVYLPPVNQMEVQRVRWV